MPSWLLHTLVKGNAAVEPPDPEMHRRAPAETDTPFLPLPEPAELVLDDPAFRYDSACGPQHGYAHLRMWRCTPSKSGAARWLAVVTEIGEGTSIANSAAEIWHALANRYGQSLVLLEYWNDGSGCGPDHLDQVAPQNGTPNWRRIWPTPHTNPAHAEFTAWALRNLPHFPPGRATTVAEEHRNP